MTSFATASSEGSISVGLAFYIALGRCVHFGETGSWFVLERWLAESPFRFAAPPGQSDLDVARGSQAKEVLEHHWDTWISEQDWAWIAATGLNSVRLPVRQTFPGLWSLLISLCRSDITTYAVRMHLF